MHESLPPPPPSPQQKRRVVTSTITRRQSNDRGGPPYARGRVGGVLMTIGQSPRPCGTPCSRRIASRASGGTEGPTRGQNKKGACRTKLHRERRPRWRSRPAVRGVPPVRSA